MITYMHASADMFKSDADAWVNTVNCKGVMGGGIALLFKERFPQMYLDYRNKCNVGLIKPGSVNVYANDYGEPNFILNVATKDDYCNPSELKWIEEAVEDLSLVVQQFRIKKVALPALGCGLGGLSFADVKKFYDYFLTDSDCIFEAYGPK
jgi:O-acetyl-ADP-ribose deacetylase (regulator of RNase III)